MHRLHVWAFNGDQTRDSRAFLPDCEPFLEPCLLTCLAACPWSSLKLTVSIMIMAPDRDRERLSAVGTIVRKLRLQSNSLVLTLHSMGAAVTGCTPDCQHQEAACTAGSASKNRCTYRNATACYKMLTACDAAAEIAIMHTEEMY
jgi:hypothetical protein